MQRRLDIARKAFTRFIDRCNPSQTAQDVIYGELLTLEDDAYRGYRILFVYQPLYQIRIGPYVANYEFDDQIVKVVFIGIMGMCP